MENFAEDVRKGLSAELKYLPSKYFYDEQGSKLFQAIMKLEEYYPTRCEAEILSIHREEICRMFTADNSPFELVELGAGDGSKTRILLSCFNQSDSNLTYLPIDISPSILTELIHSVKQEFTNINTEAIAGEYFEVLSMLKRYDTKRRILLFLGSTIGNFDHEGTIDFLQKLREQMNDNDMLMIGFDLQKHPRVISDAYNDRLGITREFNLNLLTRINRELNADFDPKSFEHYPVYDPSTGEARSYLISIADQNVSIGDIGIFAFRQGEAIHTEVSRKYTLKGIEQLAERTGFSIVKNFTDSKCYFTDSLWKPV
jgi:dimethylhistidine N-methyltransferase